MHRLAPRLLILAALSFVLVYSAMGKTVVTIIPSIGPTYGPSLAIYEANAEYAIQHNLTSYGTPNTPGYYQAITSGSIAAAGIFATDGTYNAWMGDLNPGTDYGSAFAHETGNALFFGLDITSTNSDPQFNLPGISYSSIFFGLGPPGNTLAGTGFPKNQVGIDLNNILAYPPTVCPAGNCDAVLLNVLYSSGIAPLVQVPLSDYLTDINLNIGQVVDFSYTLNFPVGPNGTHTSGISTGTFDVNLTGGGPGVPEPGTVALLGIGLGAIACFRRKRV